MNSALSSPRAERDELICGYQRYVQNLAGLMITTMMLPRSMIDDLISAGLLGLVEAAERFDSRQGKNFKTYAFYRIRGAMIDSIRRTSDFSGRAYRAARALDAYISLREEHNHSQDGEKHKTRARKLDEILNLAAEGALAFRMGFPDDGMYMPPELCVFRNAEQLMIKDQSCRKISLLVETLPEKERLIVEEYYTNGLSFVEITEKYPTLSKSWVSRLHKRALQRLRHAICLEEEACSDSSPGKQ